MSDNKKRANNLYDAIGNLPDELLGYKEGYEDMKVNEAFLNKATVKDTQSEKVEDSSKKGLEDNVVEFSAERKKSPIVKVLLACAACAAVALIVVSAVMINNNKKDKKNSTAASATPQATSEAKATVKPTASAEANKATTAPAEIQHNEVATDIIAKITKGNTTSRIESGETYIAPVQFGDDFDSDLNLDGTDEKICIDKTEDDNGKVSLIPRINGVELGFDMIDDMDGCENSFKSYYIVDFDSSDKYKEIAIVVPFGNDCTKVKIFRYREKTLEHSFTIDGMVAFNAEALAGDKILYESHPSEFFTLWYIGRKYSLSDVSLVQYTKWMYETTGEIKHTTNQDITVYSEDSTGSEESTLAKGAEIKLIATDETEWVIVELSDGTLKYIHMADQSNVDSDGKSVSTEGLLK